MGTIQIKAIRKIRIKMNQLTELSKKHTIYSCSLKKIVNLKSKWICLIRN
jgi:hypothetical protein